MEAVYEIVGFQNSFNYSATAGEKRDIQQITQIYVNTSYM